MRYPSQINSNKGYLLLRILILTLHTSFSFIVKVNPQMLLLTIKFQLLIRI